MITAEQVKALRDRTGVSLGECKKALETAAGDETRALESLRAAGVALQEKKANRALGAGLISVYLHSDGRLGALAELVCETDFVAKNPAFKQLADDLAMQVAAFAPADSTALLAQPFIRDQSRTVADLLRESVQKFGERIELTRFSRLAVGD